MNSKDTDAYRTKKEKKKSNPMTSNLISWTLLEKPVHKIPVTSLSAMQKQNPETSQMSISRGTVCAY